VTLETFKLSGPEIVRLMRAHNVTIAGLSAKTQITQKRIRQIRNSQTGLVGHTACDWFENITGALAPWMAADYLARAAR
jgi:hypothetical protein